MKSYRKELFFHLPTRRGLVNITPQVEEALREMEADPVIMDVLGGHVASHYIHGKMKEWNEYCIRVSNWELEKYLVTY